MTSSQLHMLAQAFYSTRVGLGDEDHGGKVVDRVDGRDMEPGDWLYESQPWMRALLCGSDYIAIQKRRPIFAGQDYNQATP